MTTACETVLVAVQVQRHSVIKERRVLFIRL